MFSKLLDNHGIYIFYWDIPWKWGISTRIVCVCVFLAKKRIIWRDFIGIMADDSYVDLEFSELLGWLGGR